MSGAGSFVKTGSGTLTLSGDSTYTGATTLDSGRLMVNGSLVSDVAVNGGTLGGTGTVGGIVVNGGGTVAPGNSIGTLNVANNATFNAGSTYQVEINAAGQSDLLLVSNAATLNGGTVRVLAATGTYAPSTTYTILTALGGVTGTFAGVTSNFAFLEPGLEYDPTNVFLTLERNATNFPDVARTPNQRAVAGALEDAPADSALFLDVLNQTAAGARQAFDALSGEVHASLSGILIDQSRYVRDAISDRMRQAFYANDRSQIAVLSNGGPTSVAALDNGRMALGALGAVSDDRAIAAPSRLTFWSSGFGAWGQFDGDGNAATADRNLGGFISGMDAYVGDGWRAGLATGYIHSNVSVGARSSSADVNSFVLAGYAGGGVGPIALRSGGSWTWHDIDTSRNVIFPGFFESETASYNGDTGQLFAEASYPMATSFGAVEPFAGLAYVHAGIEGFTESGATAALTASDSDENVGYTTLGVRAATTLYVSGVAVTPRVSAAWQHAFGDITPDLTLAFVSTGTAFGIAGVPLAQDSALVEAGLDFSLGVDTTLGVSYSGQIADDLQDHGVQGRLMWRF
jgi:outer membrane autotransporter protein